MIPGIVGIMVIRTMDMVTLTTDMGTHIIAGIIIHHIILGEAAIIQPHLTVHFMAGLIVTTLAMEEEQPALKALPIRLTEEPQQQFQLPTAEMQLKAVLQPMREDQQIQIPEQLQQELQIKPEMPVQMYSLKEEDLLQIVIQVLPM